MAAPLQPVAQAFHQLVQRKRRFGDQTEIDIAARQGGVDGDEAGVPAHEFDQPDPVAGALGLGVRGVDSLDRLGYGRLEAEGPLYVGDVVVDGLGNADHADLQAAPPDFLGDRLGAAQRSVSADREENADVHAVQRVDHLADVLVAARGSQDRPAVLVNAADRLRIQFDRGMPEPVGEALVSIGKAEDGFDLVVVVQAQYDRSDHIVQARAKPAAGDDAALELGGIEVDLRTGACFFKGRQLAAR